MERLPFYLKLSQIIVGVIGFFFILYVGKAIIVPLTFALLLAILLNPVVNFLNRKGLNRVIAIMLAIIMLLIIIGGIFLFIGSQVSMFSDAWPDIQKKMSMYTTQLLSWFSDTFNIGRSKINKWIVDQKTEQLQGAGGMIGDTLSSLSGAIIVLLLLPVYIFLFLFYKPLLLQFIRKLFTRQSYGIVTEVLTEIQTLIQSYLTGLLIEMVIVAALNSVALLIIGIPYAILLGVIGAILNLVPYIGGIVATSLPMLMGVIDDEPKSALFVLLAYIIIQVIDNNFLVPKIVASKVKVNALVSIVVVLIGGAIWDVSGMFLSIPLIAILKVVFDRIDQLEPFGFLIGDTMPDPAVTIFKPKKDPGREPKS